MKRGLFFSTRKMRDRVEQAARETERFSVRTATIAAFRAGRLAVKAADEKAAARSPLEKSEAQGTSNAERRKSAPAV
jgi:hypothetical protein